jgi:hypothetical protein
MPDGFSQEKHKRFPKATLVGWVPLLKPPVLGLVERFSLMVGRLFSGCDRLPRPRDTGSGFHCGTPPARS